MQHPIASAPSINPAEVEKFSRMAEEWWDPNGKFRPLHLFNPIRLAYIRQQICTHFSLNPAAIKPLENLNLLDIGCGGGLLCEPMARLGATVTGIDASEKNIAVASIHAQQSGIPVSYLATSAETLATEQKESFDIILNMEVIEHVADIASFINASLQLLKPEGLLIIATLNRTFKSLALAKIGAEYILRWLPKGTHEWQKFLKPSELASYIQENNGVTLGLQGVSFSPLTWQWALSDDVSVNYMMLVTKP